MSGPHLDELQREVVLRPDDAGARYRLAEALFAARQWTVAIEQLEQALRLDDGDGNARRLLARAYERADRPADALGALQELARRAPDDAAARDDLVALFVTLGRVDDALVQAEEAVRLAPSDPRRRRVAAELYRRQRLLPQARAALEAALALAPADAALIDELRALYLELGDEAAAERLDGARRRPGPLAQAQAALATAEVARLVGSGALARAAAWLAAGEVAGCKRALVLAAAADKASAGYSFLRGEVWLVDGDVERAARAFTACVAGAPEVAVAWRRLAQLRHDAGRLREALDAWAQLLRLAPDDAAAHEAVGDLHAQLGQRDLAAAAYAAARHGGARIAARLRALDEAARAATPAIGRLGVLGWSPLGGALSPLEAVAVAGAGQLVCSGNVGALGREAAQVAFSCIKVHAREWQLEEAIAAHDLHFHFTDTEIGKDGPSVGLALLLAGVSALRQRPLRARLAATGELTLHGEVKPVGGVHEKLVAARLAGAQLVLLPRRNLAQLRELPPEVAARLQLVLVDTVAEALEHALA